MRNVTLLDNWTKVLHDKPSSSHAPTASSQRHPAEYVVLIIGGQRNIGMLTALQYAEAGVETILLTARDAKSLDSTISQLEQQLNGKKITLRGLPCDPASNDSVKALAETVRNEYKRLDVVILNAGYSGDVILDLTRTPPGSFQTASDVNYMGTFHAMHHLIPLLLASPATPSGDHPGKSFVCIGSFAAAIVDGVIANAQYCVSKLGQARLCEYAALQFGEQGLLVGCVHPGAVDTDLARSSKGAEPFLRYCTDDPKLGGAFVVWFTSRKEEHMWLSGRILSATWDLDELVSRKEEVVSKDLFKARFST